MESHRKYRSRARPLISPAVIAHWRTKVPWVSDDNVEQDLILSRLMIEIARHPLLRSELVMRGGTCFHKLWLDRPWRYSEDLDYVRRSAGPIKPTIDAIHDIASVVGFDDVSVAIGQRPKARLRSTFSGGIPMRVKVEINTFERSPALTTTRPLAIDSPWFYGAADVPTFVVEELVATKIRALYQRRKGRDLFDLWLAVHAAGVEPSAIAASFHPYRPDGWAPRLALANLEKKISERIFATDLAALVVSWPEGYSVEAGVEVVKRIIDEVE